MDRSRTNGFAAGSNTRPTISVGGQKDDCEFHVGTTLHSASPPNPLSNFASLRGEGEPEKRGANLDANNDDLPACRCFALLGTNALRHGREPFAAIKDDEPAIFDAMTPKRFINLR
jgi:hypothetical protein